jgi:hypothetical protein
VGQCRHALVGAEINSVLAVLFCGVIFLLVYIAVPGKWGLPFRGIGVVLLAYFSYLLLLLQ